MNKNLSTFVLLIAAVGMLTLVGCQTKSTKLDRVPEAAVNLVEEQRSTYALAIHGGAGTITAEGLTPEQEQNYLAALEAALDRGEQILKDGGTSMDAVIACITLMEDDPGFNAGKGAVFTHEGRNELDASVMRGHDRQAGAVAGVTTVRNPVVAARAVLEQSPHVLLSGRGADDFAAEHGLELVDPSYFFTADRYESLQKAISTERGTGDATTAQEKVDWKYGTVGAVALDTEGHLAAGTSTGGMTNKRWNRIGDSPLIGSGTWADDRSCAVSCTGHGEFFIRNAVAHDLSARVLYRGDELVAAAEAIIMEELPAIGAGGGLIAIDRSGAIAMPFNTAGMFRGWAKPGQRWTGMYGGDSGAPHDGN